MKDIANDLKQLMEEEYLSTSDKFILHVAIGEFETIEKQIAELLAALKAMLKLWENLSKEMNWATSALSADTFVLMNEEPNKARQIITKIEGG